VLVFTSARSWTATRAMFDSAATDVAIVQALAMVRSSEGRRTVRAPVGTYPVDTPAPRGPDPEGWPDRAARTP